MSLLIGSAAGLILFTVLMAVLRKRKLSLAAYIACCIAAGACLANLVMAVYGHYYGVFNLYFYIVATLLAGLLLDWLVQKLVKTGE